MVNLQVAVLLLMQLEVVKVQVAVDLLKQPRHASFLGLSTSEATQYVAAGLLFQPRARPRQLWVRPPPIRACLVDTVGAVGPCHTVADRISCRGRQL